MSFEETFQHAGDVAGGGDRPGRARPERARADLRPDQPARRDRTATTTGSNVDLVVEIADAREANRSYEANLKMFDQARQMASSLLDLLRR